MKRPALDVGRLLGFGALLVVAILIGLWLVLRFSPTAVDRSDIVRLSIEPHPEGENPPRFLRTASASEPEARSLYLVDEYIPLPLPAPEEQGTCASGGSLLVELASGRRIQYGPCRRPDSIDHLWAHMMDVLTKGECRPRCGPEGERIPLHRQ